ncbi:6-pyruvoyltetrahydropterin/6-carboxytetrahydropterin synthase [Ectothiorhodosinus mongolicus]|uniref:6-carboxy-5,6,7,8-tetrahydropterin synthase n=1 Tax=Ectothiorhodosinus mongolicus TaxID=233100 RepID=A0A1R3W346_9GAMM|nr:6-carboxytetrahydropterin synthase QueD [Ectothiorhodosinus mongolicus]ULX57327.1 6-carboxytetrahydropterin synthase QueD [Ectothiorhodosinus mongolicus]SIT70986.1 6-pyruvoyltetrahydropterin/6-carboxytetrahydropterin synthase [Ectothiorhodosinus mongolicus]
MATPLYNLKVLTEFCAAHTLRDYPGNCARMHGHNWKVEVEVESSVLDNLGMVLDFKTIKQYAREVTEIVDHRYLNDLPAFQNQNPTAENIAAWFFKEMSERLSNNKGIQLKAITLWETDRACVRYTEN